MTAYGPRPSIAPGTTRVLDEYGVEREQRGEWWVPPQAGDETGPLPTVVLVHGGFWKPGYDRSLEDAVAADLAGRGFLVWNLDYRSSAAPWPATTDDVRAGYEYVVRGRRGSQVDRARIAVVGHSAGGHLALFLASCGVPKPALAIAQAGVADLVRGSEDGLGGGAVDALLGGKASAVPDRCAAADPVGLVPTGVRTVLIHGRSDTTVPFSQARAYLAAATAAGDACTLEAYDGGHYEHLDPQSDAVRLLRRALESL